MIMLVLAFIAGLISANWITLRFDEQFIQTLLDGLDQANALTQKGIETGWRRYQNQRQSTDAPNPIAPVPIDSVQK